MLHKRMLILPGFLVIGYIIFTLGSDLMTRACPFLTLRWKGVDVVSEVNVGFSK